VGQYGVMEDTYTHGHHESVLRSHTARTAENSAAYLLPSLRPGLSLLDVGCGPGTITADLARRVDPGRVLGLDRAGEVLDTARSLLGDAAPPNLTFAAGDVYALDVDDASFDVVHAHQVLQHLTDPVAALREMRRVLVPGGVLAVRDGDYGAFVWAPADPLLDRWREVYDGVTRHNRAEPDAGRHLPSWVRAAGFTDLHVSSANWTWSTTDDRAWWGNLWADRTTSSTFGEQALAYGLSDRDELEAIAAAFRGWADQPDGVFVVVNVEVLARR
jgi:ubiquinone/menaquinone biosynthesis C-methylase UbiE